MISDVNGNSTIEYFELSGEILIHHSLSTVTLTQKFKNTSDTSAETEYSVTLDKNSVLISLQAVFNDGSTIECEVIEKEEAKEKFQDKISKGHSPVLATQESQYLQIFIGLLPAGHNISIRLVYTYPLTTLEDSWKFELIKGFVQETNMICNFTLRVISDSQIISGKSNWDFEIELSDKLLIGVFDSRTKSSNPDNLEFVYKCVDTITPKCLIQRSGNLYAAMLSFIPYCDSSEDIDDYEPIGEFIFLLDRSGSMAGSRISLAKEAASLFIKSLSSRSTFNIISFGSKFEFMFPNSCIANSANVNEAIGRVKEFKADMGGTEIYQPLSAIFSMKPVIGQPRFIFLLTDGDVSSPERVLGLILEHSKDCKVYSFGIEEANKMLIEGVAKNGNGDSYNIREAKDIGKSVINALEKCVMPFISNARLNWECEPVPRLDRMQTVHFGQRFCVFTVVEKLPEVKPVFMCFDSFKERELRFEIDQFVEIEGDEIFKLWAKQKIEEGTCDVLEISIKYQVISPKTALFCFKKNTQGIKTDIIPLVIKKKELFSKLISSSSSSSNSGSYINSKLGPNHFGCLSDSSSSSESSPKFHQTSIAAPIRLKAESRPPPIKSEPRIPFNEPESIINLKAKRFSSSSSSDFDNNYAMEKCKMAPPILYVNCARANDINSSIKPTEIIPNLTQNRKIHLEIVLLQDPAGFWHWNQIATVIKASPELIHLSSASQDERVSATALALAYLDHFCSIYKEEWTLIEKKALRWLKKQSIDFQALISIFKQHPSLNP